MVYAVVTEADKNAFAMQFFQSKKIPKQHLYPMSNLSGLVQVLSQGDTVWVLDVDRFGSVTLYWNFYQVCRQRGVMLKFWANPYLNIGNDKKMKKNQEEFIGFLIRLEQKISTDICRAFRDANVPEVQKYIGYIEVNTLAEVFSTKGIMNRTAS